MAAQEQPREVTPLMVAWNEGHESAREPRVLLVYAELGHLARRYMLRELPDHTLLTTALINEVHFQLVSSGNVHGQRRAHFFSLCGRLMRRILVDIACSSYCAKRGGGAQPISLERCRFRPGCQFVAVDDAPQTLAKIDVPKAQVVELRFFGRVALEETAEALKVSPEAVRRDCRVAKVCWLLCELTGAH